MTRSVFLLSMFAYAIVANGDDQHSTVVLYDAGNTVSAAPYLRFIEQAESRRDDAINDAQAMLDAANIDPQPVTLEAFFPFRSERLRPAAPSQKQVDQLTSPLFVIGMDAASLSWLEDSFEQLKTLGAQGLVVEADNFDAFDALQRKALSRGIMIDIAPGDALAEGFGIHSYPVLLVAK